MNLANLITMVRIILVPAIVWALLDGRVQLAFFVFVLAGLSDAVDGAVARTFDQQTEFGTALDPIADKTMLVSVFVVLAYLDEIPLWLAILVLSRDVLIIVGFMMAYFLARSMSIRPLMISKANTFAQIVLAAYVLGLLAFDLDLNGVKTALVAITALLTLASAFAYMVQGLRFFASAEPDSEAR